MIDEGPYTARQAVDRGLVNGLLYEDQLDELAAQKLPRGAGLLRLADSTRGKGGSRGWSHGVVHRLPIWWPKGLIMAGESRRGRGARPLIGADSLVDVLKAARESKRIRAVVLRLNSPGGSALASDLIWRAVKLTAEKKPVIISFGNVAASGGYYIAVAGTPDPEYAGSV